MKTLLSSGKGHLTEMVSLLLVVAVLFGGTIGCVPTRYALSITSTEVGTVTAPGEGSSTYNAGSVVELVAEADEVYQFVGWTGDVDTVDDVYAPTTKITILDTYYVTANFEELDPGTLFAGGDGTAADPYQISNWNHLHNVRDYLGDHFVLINDLRATSAGYSERANRTANEGKGWEPIGYGELDDEECIGEMLEGVLDGRGYEIRDLYIDRPEEECVGLFGAIGEGGVVENLGVVGVNVTGWLNVGGLVGFNHGTVRGSGSSGRVTAFGAVGGLVGMNVLGGSVEGSHSTGSITGMDLVGGLVGGSFGRSSVSDSYFSGTVTGRQFAGGLVGGIHGGWYGHGGSVSRSHAIGSVTGFQYVGGLAGVNMFGAVTDCHSSSSVIGNSWSVGGLIGLNGALYGGGEPLGYLHSASMSSDFNDSGVIGGWFFTATDWEIEPSIVSNCFSTGSVAGDEVVGGLVGLNAYLGSVTDSYSTGSVSGDVGVGGLVGVNYYDAFYAPGAGSISGCYAIGKVSGQSSVGGLVGNNPGSVSASFWDVETSGTDKSDGGTGKTTAEMMSLATFTVANWHITAVGFGQADPAYIWNIVDGETYPFLSWESG